MAKDKEVRFRIRALDRMSSVLTKVRRQFPRLANSVKRASRAFQIAAEKSKKFRRAMSKISGTMKNIGRGMVTRVSAPIALAGAAIIKTGVDFQRSINKVGAITRTIMGGQVTPQFHALEKQAMELGRTTEFSAVQAADAMGLLGRAGFSANEILASTDDVLALASASGMDLAFTADIMAKSIRAFGLSANDAQRVSDVLADVSRRTNVDLETIGETFKATAPIAAQYGASIEEAAAITGLLGDVGIQGSIAGTAMKNIMLKMAAPTAAGLKLWKRLGVEAFDPATKKMKSVGAILTELGPKLGKLNKNDQLGVLNELFGLRGITGAASLMAKAMKDGKDPVAKLTEILKNSKGAAKDMQKTMLRGAVGAMARFRSALEGLGLAFAKSGLLDAFSDILEVTTEWMSSLAELEPGTLRTIMIIGGLVAAVGPLLVLLAPMVSMVGIAVPAFQALAAAAGMTGGAMFLVTAQVLLLVAAIAVLAFFLERATARWDQMVAGFKAGDGILDSVGNVFEAFAGGTNFKEILANKGKVFPGRKLDRATPEGMKREKERQEENKGAFNIVGDIFNFVTGKETKIPSLSLPGLGGDKEKGQEREGDDKGGFLQGFTKLGAAEALKNLGKQTTERTNNAKVEVTVKSEGPEIRTRAQADDMDSIRLNTGLSGAAQ